MIGKPIPESYWVVTGKFLAGAYPVSYTDPLLARHTLAAFLEFGITDFFDLTKPGELTSYHDELQQESERYGIPVHHQRFPIQDKGLPSISAMGQLLNSLDATLDYERKVYLHCRGGIGRTGTTVGCWLVRHGMKADQALVRLNEFYSSSEQCHFYPRSPETEAQVKFILDWAEEDNQGARA